MDIKDLITERDALVDENKELNERILANSERIKRLDVVFENLRIVHPEFFVDKPIGAANNVEAAVQTSSSASLWDMKSLLVNMNRFTKVSELAKIAMQNEPFFTTETEESLQKKISAALTALKANPKEGLATKKVHPGSSGVAWGLSEWVNMEEHNYLHKMNENEEVIRNRELWEQQQ